MTARGERSHDPERLESLLEGELGLLGTSPPVPLSVVKAWDEAVGEHVARRSRPSRLKGKTLHVKVASSTWMSELQLLAPSILARLAERPALARVEELRFELGLELGPSPGRGGASTERPPAPRRSRASLSRPRPEAIARALDRVGDRALRERIEGVLDQVLPDEDEDAG